MVPENHPEDAQNDAANEAEHHEREQTDERDPSLDAEPVDVSSTVAIDDVITSKHWLPSNESDFHVDGDLRARIHLGIENVTIEKAVEMDPEDPDPVKVIGAWWIHADCHGIMTPDIFHLDLQHGIAELCRTIREDQDPFQPVRLYKEARNAYGVGFFDFAGGQFPFDIRVVAHFGTWQFTTEPDENGETQEITSSGFKFQIATLVMPTPDDHDVYVGHDWGKIFDAE